MKNERVIGIDICKIMGMLMICVLHYVGHGGVLSNENFIISTGGYLAKSVCIVGVNLYMLSTGYLMYKHEFKINRVVKIWTETLFYSVLIAIFMFISSAQLIKEEILKSFFPVVTIEYWYVTSYIILLFFIPALNKMVVVLSRKQAYGLLCLIMLFFSAWKSIFPNNGLLETGYLQGYGIVWMMCMYLFGAILKKYPIWMNIKKIMLLSVYCFCVILAFSSNLVCRHYGIMNNGDKIFDYNHIFTLCGSVVLFLFFLQIKVKKESVSSAINKISSHTLAVYLIQEQVGLKYILWSAITKVTIVNSYIGVLLLSVIAILIIFISCILIDILRKELFDYLRIDNHISDLIERLVAKAKIIWIKI